MKIKGKDFAFLLNGKEFHCSMDITMHYIGGKWKTVLLWYLRNETLRFAELKKKIPDITEKMLSIQLKALEQDKLIVRKVHGVKPPVKVEYCLSPLGKTLIPTLNAIAAWGREQGEKRGKLIERKTGS
jgi:DNA-binding HxlR family transcriptional regulator